jgi:uncharacterized membrane protein HdeD (DUF308 family)
VIFALIVLSVALFVIGIARVPIGVFVLFLPDGFQKINSITGVFSIIVLLSSAVGFRTLIVLLSVTFLFKGTARAVSGLTSIQ